MTTLPPKEIEVGSTVSKHGVPESIGVVKAKSFGGWCLVDWENPSAELKRIIHVQDLK